MKNDQFKIKRKRITLGDIAISYLIREVPNPRQWVVYLHGFPFNKNMWISQLEALPEHVAGIAIDIRGHGQSTMGHGFFSIDVFARDLLAFLKALALPPVVISGVSMGGYVALRAYELQPDAFSGMILTGSHPLPDDNAGKSKRFDTIQSVLNYGKRAFSLGFVEQVFSGKSLTENNPNVDLIKSAIRRNNERGICATLLALASRTDTQSMLSDIQVPVMVIRGKDDRICTEAHVAPLLAKIKDVHYHECPDSGHLPNLEETEAYNVKQEEFLLYLAK
jgi:pimeloyl-ACP methyl ester carboxylesterase